MRKSWVLVVGMFALAGCALEPEAPSQTAEASDLACSTAADARARDAAINGYDEDAQRIIRQESYKSCVTWSKKAIVVDTRSH